MKMNNVIDLERRDENEDPVTDMLRAGAQQLIQQAVEAELQSLLDQHAESRTPAGTTGVVRNGYLPERDLQTSLGPVPARIPKVRSKAGEPVTFHSLVPPHIRKTRTLEAALCLQKRPRGIDGLLQLSGETLAEHQDEQSY